MEKFIFDLDHIFINVEAKNKDDALEIIAKKIVDTECATDYKKVLKGLYHREKEGSTGFNNGIAIPHVRIKQIIKPGVFIFKYTNGIEWNSIDGSLVKIAISLAVPENNASADHIKILSSIATKLVDDNFRRELNNAISEQEIFDIISKIEIK